MARPDEAVPLKTGDILDRKYRVERVLGAGGMGIVVSARHIELGTRVALKLMQPKLATDPESVLRFQREARAAVRMKGEHVARVTDVGRLENDVPYMVMEFLAGRDLGQMVGERGPLPIADAVGYVLQAAEGIAEAHSLGIIHRDLKPQNLFLTRRPDGTPLVKVLDFGLVKALEGGGMGAVALTQTMSVMGSPVYMSPEQMRSPKEVGTPTDIWSLGVCLYELLLGTVPFDGTTAFEVCAKVLNEAPRPPHEARADVPAALSAAILRCLEKDPKRRCVDVAELATALEPFGLPGSRGASERIRAILLAADVRMDSAPPPRGPNPSTAPSTAIGPTAETVVSPGRPVDTRTVATIDSGGRTERFAALGGVLAVIALLLVVGTFFALRGSPDRVVTAAPAPPQEPLPPVVAVAPPATSSVVFADASPPPTASARPSGRPAAPPPAPAHATRDAGVRMDPAGTRF